MEDESNSVLGVIGGSIVARVRTGEVGVFNDVDVQNNVLDAVERLANPSQEVKDLHKIFLDTKLLKARAFKLNQLVLDKLEEHGSGPSVETQPEPQRVTSQQEQPLPTTLPASAPDLSSEDHRPTTPVAPASTRAREDTLTEGLVTLNAPVRYRLADQLISIGGVVRIRSEPSSEAQQVGVVASDDQVDVNAFTDSWLRLTTGGWVMRKSPMGQDMFVQALPARAEPMPKTMEVQEQQPVVTLSTEEYRQLMHRVDRLEAELERVKTHFRKI